MRLPWMKVSMNILTGASSSEKVAVLGERPFLHREPRQTLTAVQPHRREEVLQIRECRRELITMVIVKPDA